ncbi:MAG: PKD domain-containing protein [Clostridiaceae bacterium]|nr:PKD domain-containing protein [Clostridiaceae bacterium]
MNIPTKHRFSTRLFAIILSFCMLPIGDFYPIIGAETNVAEAVAASQKAGVRLDPTEADGIKTTLYVDKGDIVIGQDTISAYDGVGNLISDADPDGYIITQTDRSEASPNTVLVSGGTHNISLSSVNIQYDQSLAPYGCFILESGAMVNLDLIGFNSIVSGPYYAGIRVPSGATLTVSSDTDGELSSTGGVGGAGIGGDNDYPDAGSITINSGIVTAIGSSYYGAGIGGGYSIDTGIGGSCGLVDINEGTVTASSAGGGAGIGSGYNGGGGSIRITGGNITARSEFYGAGIGGGYRSKTVSVAIEGGTINASSKGSGAGIGGGYEGSGASVDISGGEITAVSEAGNGAGIGDGYEGGGGSIRITGGDITARSDMNGAGIGGGSYSEGFSITIEDGVIDATSLGHGSGIGTGMQGELQSITISGGTVTAVGGTNAAGIGRADNGSTSISNSECTITINGGEITATGGVNGAGIGAGFGPSPDIFINGGNITGFGGDRAAGIGGSPYYDMIGTITITGGVIHAYGNNGGAGIGAGQQRNASEILIEGGSVYAFGSTCLDEYYNADFPDDSDGIQSAGIGGGAVEHYIDTTEPVASKITISGGTIFEVDDRAAEEPGDPSEPVIVPVTIGSGEHAEEPAIITIDGGSIHPLTSTYTYNSQGIEVFRTIIPLTDAVGLPVTELTLTQNGTEYPYGIKDIVTDELQNICVYIPGIEEYHCSAVCDEMTFEQDFIPGGATLMKLDQTNFRFEESNISVEYGTPDFSIEAIGGLGTGAVTYELMSGENVVSLTANTVSLLDLGTAEIRAYIEADENHKEARTTLLIEVIKGVPVIYSIPEVRDIDLGEALSDIFNFYVVDASVDGRAQWVDPSIVPTESGSFEALFVPTEHGRYESVSIMIPVTVRAPTPTPTPSPTPSPTPTATPSPTPTPTSTPTPTPTPTATPTPSPTPTATPTPSPTPYVYDYDLEKKDVSILCVYPSDKRMENSIINYLLSHSLPNGLSLTIDSVYLNTFNANPDLYLFDEEGNYKYDLVTVGFSDANSNKDISGVAREALSEYIRQGYGFLIGHDTICYHDTGESPVPAGEGVYAPTSTSTPTSGTHWNMDALILDSAKILTKSQNFVGNDGTSNSVFTDFLRIRKEGQVVQYPFNLMNGEKKNIDGGSFYTLNSYATHSNAQFCYGDVWVDFAESAGRTQNIITEFNGFTGTNNFYLTTTGNVGMSQMGHRPYLSDDEVALIINTIFYLSQAQTCEICGVGRAQVIRDSENLITRIEQNPDGCFVLGSNITLPSDWEPITGFTGHFNTNHFTVSYDEGLAESKRRIFADSARMEGIVTDVGNNPLSFVPVCISDGINEYEGITDIDGRYSISGIPAGSYSVSANGEELIPVYLISDTEYKLPIIQDFSVTMESFSVTYAPNLEGVSGEAPRDIHTLLGATVTVAENRFTREEFEFIEWNDGAMAYQPGDSYTVQGNVVFSAVWKDNRDLTNPLVTGITPDGGRIGKSVKLTVTATDNVSVASVSAYYQAEGSEETILIGEVPTNNGVGSIVWNTESLSGNYTVFAIATDTSGNDSTNACSTVFAVDTVGIPKIEIETAEAFSAYAELTWADVTDEDFSYFQIEQLIGGEYEAVGKEKNYTGFYVQNLLPDTEYSFRVVGYDDLGNRGEPSDVVTLTTSSDTIGPKITEVGPIQSNYSNQIALTATVTDNVGSSSLSLSYRRTVDDAWTDLATLTPSGIKAEYKYSYNWDVSALPEGRIFVKFTALDAAGNENVTSDGLAIVCEYAIDRTAPSVVENVQADGTKGMVSLFWDLPEETDIASYMIYRAAAGSDHFTQIADCETLNFYDTGVNYGSAYRYRVAAKDIAGNVGEISSIAEVTVSPDTEAPIIRSVSPKSGDNAGANQTIKVLAMDNAKLASVSLEYSPAGTDDWQTLASETTNEQYYVLTVVWNTTGLSDGMYDFRASTTDSNGNTSEIYSFSYRLDTVAPQAPVVNLIQENWQIDLEWGVSPEVDFSHYELFRKSETDSQFIFIKKLTGGYYTDLNVTPEVNYSYMLRSYDKCGNVSESAVVTGYAYRIDTVAPVAITTENVMTIAGSTFTLDATASYDNVGIVSYTWDMDDGSVLNGSQITYSYARTGNYWVKLTVRDEYGNEDICYCTVTVYGAEETGIVTLQVVNSKGTPIRFASIFVMMNQNESKNFRADKNGQIVINMKPNMYLAAAYANGYLPQEKVFSVAAGSSKTEKIVLSEGTLVSGQLTSHRMSLDEMILAGIDFDDPDNMETFTFSMRLTFMQSPLPTTYAFVYGGREIRPIVEDKEDERWNWVLVGGRGVSLEPEDAIFGYVYTRQSVSWLKNMYNVTLGVINNADPEFYLSDCKASLQLSSPVSLAATEAKQSLEQDMYNIYGQEESNVSWFVKSDIPGTHAIDAAFEGTLYPFDAPVSAKFHTTQDFETEGEGIRITLMPEETANVGEEYYVYFAVTNTSDSPIVSLTTTFGPFEDPGLKQRIVVIDSVTGKQEIINCDGEGPRFSGEFSSEADHYDLSLSKGASVSFDAIMPGQTIFGTYHETFDASGNQNEVYYYLIDSLVTVLEGQNTGVTVSVEPISSHISHYNYMYNSFLTVICDPVDYMTGAYLDLIETLSVQGSTNLSLDLEYNSLLTEAEGEVGYGWSHGYENEIRMEDGQVRFYWTPTNYLAFVTTNSIEGIVYGTVEDGVIHLQANPSLAEEYTCISYGMRDYKLSRDESGAYLMTSPAGDSYEFNADGKLTKIRESNGRTVTLTHEDMKTTVTDPASGKFFCIHYDEDGHIASATDNIGRTVSFTYSDGYLTSYTNALGETLSYSYDEAGKLYSATSNTGDVLVTNTYDEEGRVLTQDDGNPNTPLTIFSYTEDPETGVLLVEITDRNGGKIQAKSNNLGQMLSTSDQNGNGNVYTYNAIGQLISETNAGGYTMYYDYDSAGNRTVVRDYYGDETHFSYDDSGNVTGIASQGGATRTYAYNDRNLMITETDEVGVRTFYSYDDEAQLISKTVEGKGTETYEYENGCLTSVIDFMGNTTRFEYDAVGNLISITDREGAKTTFAYDLLGRVVQKTDALGGKTTYKYDEIGKTTSVTDANGNTTVFEYSYRQLVKQIFADDTYLAYRYDSEGRVTQRVDPDGKVTNTEFDPAGNAIRTSVEGVSESYTYDANNFLQTSTDANGETTSYFYYPNGQLYKVVYPDGSQMLKNYNSSWQIINVTDVNNHVTSYEYDIAGNTTCIRDTLGNETRMEYDLFGNLIRVTDPNGNETNYAYDVMGNCTSMTDALGQTYHFTYDKENRLIRTWTETSIGIVSECLKHDALGRVIETTDVNGNSRFVSYDSIGNVIRMTDALGNVIEQNNYNNMNQLIESTDALGGITKISYNDAGAIQSLVENLNTSSQTTTSLEYDEFGRMVSVVDPLNGISGCTYDNSGNVISQTDPNGGTTSFTYDSMGRITAVVNAIGSESEYTYNAAGLLAESENGRDQKATYTYDDIGRITSMTDEAGTIQYTYDNNGNLLRVQDESGTISRQYDELNRVTAYTDHNGKTVQYAYDELGNRISLTYPGGEIVRYSYNLDSSLHSVTDWDGRETIYGYDANGRLTSVVRPDGSYEIYGYDAKGRIISQDDYVGSVSINSYRFEYDAAGNITGITDSESIDPEGLENVTMTYDEANRLITYNGQDVLYDADGNMTYGPLNGIMTEFEYDARNRLIRAGETTYEYNAENRRIAVNEKSRRIEYIMDPVATLSNILVSTVYESTGDGQYSSTGSETLYVYGIGLIGEKSSDRGYLIYHFNQIGSTTAITNEAGAITNTFSYGPYGELLSGASEGFQFLYNGQYGIVTDTNGLYQMRARYYNADIKRFINQDVIIGNVSESQSMNRYSYVQGNPINALDPFGLFFMKITKEDMGHFALDVLGYLPVIGCIADFANALWYLGEGLLEGGLSTEKGRKNLFDSACSFFSALPGIGSIIGNSAKAYFKGTKFADKAIVIGQMCKVIGYTGSLTMKPFEIGDSIGNIQNAQAEGKRVDLRDVLSICWDVISICATGKDIYDDLRPLDEVYIREVKLAADSDVGMGGNRFRDADLPLQRDRALGIIYKREADGNLITTERIESLSGTATYRVPNGVWHDQKIVYHRMNDNYIYNSAQIKDYSYWAKDRGYTFILEVNPGAEVSKPLLESELFGSVIIVTR